MVSELLSYVGRVFTSPLGWFAELLNYTGGGKYWVMGLMIYCIYKFILAPIFGRARSDLARESYSAFKSSRRKDK